ncbi:MAG: TIM44-like domain-containing protein [Thiobacillaceae bacterium]
MKRIIVSLFALFIGLSFSLASFDAEARRMGGGKSFGMQRSAPARREATPQQQGTTPSASPQKRSWMGPLAGLAAGLGLAALMSHFGMGEQFANMLMIALAVMAAVMLFRYLTRPKVAPGMQYAGGNTASMNPTPFNAPARFEGHPASGSAAPAPLANAFPPGFDAQAFAREAKLNFIRMQAANDAGNIDDIRAFTTPELFAEIRLQLSERGIATQETDVVNLDAEVIECAEENGQLIASVHFYGLIREDAVTGTTPFDEIWHLSKPANGQSGWVVAGIQQNN